jgi:hypothetical protein
MVGATFLTYPGKVVGRHTLTQVESALRRADGQLSQAARLLGLSRQAIHDRVNRTPHLSHVMSEIQLSLLDQAEGVIAAALRKNDAKTAMWFLERHGQSRGYGKTPKVTTTKSAWSKEKREEAIQAILRLQKGD